MRGGVKLQVVARNNEIHGSSGVTDVLFGVHVPEVKRRQAVGRSMINGIKTRRLTILHCLKQRVDMVIRRSELVDSPLLSLPSTA